MDTRKRREYLLRLLTPDKNGDCFLFQYLEGDGNELQKKFWAPNSSSRMAFELYSGLKEYVKELKFEFKLPRLCSGGKAPNMDVMIETEHDIIFIESKFTERANLHYQDNGYLSKAYYLDGPYGRKGLSLKERFHNNEWAKEFASFCNKWEEEMVKNGWHEGCDWFEPKQETCHLSGILLYLFEKKNAARIKGKSIHLFNVYWRFDGLDGNPLMPQHFEEKANETLEKIIGKYGKKLEIVDFEIGTYTVQDIRETPELLSPDIHSLGKNVEERMKQFDDLAYGQTRQRFKVK